MRKRRRQAIERQKGIKRYNTERELSAVTAGLYISGAGLLEHTGRESISVSDIRGKTYFNGSDMF